MEPARPRVFLRRAGAQMRSLFEDPERGVKALEHRLILVLVGTECVRLCQLQSKVVIARVGVSQQHQQATRVIEHFARLQLFDQEETLADGIVTLSR